MENTVRVDDEITTKGLKIINNEISVNKKLL